MDEALYEFFALWVMQFDLEAAVKKVTGVMGVSPSDAEEFRQRYLKQIESIERGGPPILKAGGESWYPGPIAEALYWNPLRATLFEGDPDRDVKLSSVGQSSSQVVAHTPDPKRAVYDGKGLVVGYVQSGKTTNFTSVIAKMADVEYRLVIVLAGVHNGLRKQTQSRLSEQLHAPNATRWHLLTNEDGDFYPPAGPPVSVFTNAQTVLAVVKKNAQVLDRLIEWLDTSSGRAQLAKMRVLIIDDEADQASVATSSINPKIRKLLSITPRHTYIGYTATPFANVFIDPNSEDLYPKDFILSLPLPEGYFGPEKIFGNDLPQEDPASVDGYDMVRIVPVDEEPYLRPKSRADAANFAPQLTPELRRAILWFWLATSARRARGQLSEHSTMLVHTAIPTVVHRAFRAPVEKFRDSVLSSLEADDSFVLDELRELWEEESPRVPASEWSRAQNDFEELLAHLTPVVGETRVILDNSMSDERLVYEKGKPLTAIAIGGNTLSRGLTLEGLVVSFFVRSAKTYDTLMQMGRWFGYRTGYEDLPRIWMTEELRRYFGHLVTVEREMRQDIDHYQRQDLTPVEVAVRIRTHPILQITAKMGAAAPQYVSYGGRRLYTRYFKPDDATWLKRNLTAASQLVERAAEAGDEDNNGPVALYRNVPWKMVTRFLRDYRVHEDSPDLDRRLMTKYIKDRVDEGSLEHWTIAVVQPAVASPGVEPIELGGREWNAVVRSKLKGGDGQRADVKNVMNKEDRAIDLGIPAATLKGYQEQQLVELREKDESHRDRGLLVLYPIDAMSEPQTARAKERREPMNAAASVIGFGIVFPGVPEEKTRLRAEKVAVDLTNVITEDPAAYQDDSEGVEETVD